MKLLIACDRNYAIGYQGDMLFKISADQKRFKKMTTGNIVVMGRRTLESLPGGKALPDRMNVVLTRSEIEPQSNLIAVKNEKELLAKLDELNPDQTKEVYVIGGGKTVASLLPRIDEAYITMLDRIYPKADAWVPNLRTDSRYQLVEETAPVVFEDTSYTYQVYKKIKKN